MFFFQLPWLPEQAFRKDDFARGVASLRDSSRPGTFSEADLDALEHGQQADGAGVVMRSCCGVVGA